MSLDAYDSAFTSAKEGDIPPAGKESHELHGQERSPVAGLIIIEDASLRASKASLSASHDGALIKYLKIYFHCKGSIQGDRCPSKQNENS